MVGVNPNYYAVGLNPEYFTVGVNLLNYFMVWVKFMKWNF